ncbi:MAG: sugar phosphate isomerase/epimerase [Pedosphaera sp.]|nr:sugar phosphate isomerase/epimerase [Pedosphaera sp.]
MHLKRRQFLAIALPAVAAASLHAAEPFARQGKARLRLGLAAYSFRSFFKDGNSKAAPAGRAIDLFGFIDFCADNGCDGAELTSYYFPKDPTEEFLIKLRRHAFLRAVAISGTAVGNNFTHPAGEERTRQIASVKQWIDRAAILGAPHIRVFAGVAKGITEAESDRNIISALEECSAYAGKRGLFLGLENHDSIGNAARLLALVRAVKSPWLGVNLDTGNFHTEDPYEDIALTAPFAVNVQLKVELRRRGAKASEPADLPRKIKLLREANYQGYVTLEYEAAQDPWTAVPPYLKRMRELLA